MNSLLRVSLDTYLDSFHLSLNFSAAEGKTTVLLGESGAGKSTVLRLLAGLQHPQQGHISLDSVTYFDNEQKIVVPPQERPFGYVFQDYILFPHLTVFENVAFGLRAQHLPSRLIRARVSEALDRVHLVGYDMRKPAQLSGGQQQRVAIARALALQPQLLLLDEPLSALDVQTRREVRQELQHILAELHITTIMVTHQYLEALLFGHSILVLDDGHIIQQGDQRDLLEYPRSSYVAELIGVNFFRGRIVRYEADGTCVIALQNSEYQPFEIFAALSEQGQEATPDIGEEAYVVVNPRSVTLYQSPPDASARNLFPGTITQVLRLRSGGVQSRDGYVRVSIALDGLGSKFPPLTAEITEVSATRLRLQQQRIYAAFKATEASAYT
ncbi:ABC transporter ATP-binding protein [Reticulibacter mediterranei]|uniref:ABC-type quaternary amine transporter n=1 Tax=Reticulibacter mediterranei TaxID=2778369 RepID=A0A8J3IH35_9CHLR|nr:ATP-binding cassette domain-containing protein [Reticulibacter mediterranei]GHO93528.1 ABC transporter ATP-binding protein [Reticulibacter mediterranei]